MSVTCRVFLHRLDAGAPPPGTCPPLCYQRAAGPPTPGPLVAELSRAAATETPSVLSKETVPL